MQISKKAFRGAAIALLAAGLSCSTAAWGQERLPESKKLPARAKLHDPNKNNFASEMAAAWAPADVDSSVPTVAPDAPCSLAEVVKSAGERAQELVNSLPQFTATEKMQHYELEKSGEWGKPQTVVFDYLVEMKKVRPGMLIMEETRDGGLALQKFPARLATLGLPVVAMVFHPYFVGEYEMKCEGLGQWEGRRAWQVYFQQRPDKYPRLRGYRVKDQSFAIRLKGRAWLDAETYQPLHIETDLMQPVPEILLVREHLAVDYRPVHFKKENEDLWLQQSADMFVDFRGHRYHRLHSFSNFLLFSVDVDQKDTTPKESN